MKEIRKCYKLAVYPCRLKTITSMQKMRGLTRHVHHPAVAVFHNVARFTVDPAGGHTVDLEKAGLQSSGLTLSPRGRQVGELGERKEGR